LPIGQQINEVLLKCTIERGKMGTVSTEIKKIILSTSEESRYDEKAKAILSNKHMMARILCQTVDEFKGMNPKEVFYLIEGDPIISRVPVDSGMTNYKEVGEKIAGLNTVDSENNEGYVMYDIILYVRMRDGLAQIIINVEAQKNEPTEYNIINRTIFYICRMVSSQKNRDFVKKNYDDIKQVYSIWICMDLEENCMNHIHLTDDKVLGNHTWKGRLDILNIVMVGLGKEIPEKDEEDYEMHRLLGTVFSDNLSVDDKIKVMEDEYDIPMEEQLKEDLVDMCNLSKGITAKYEAKGIIQTALEFGVSESEIVNKLQEKLQVTSQQAQEYFKTFGKQTV
jgi:hypothetical protein